MISFYIVLHHITVYRHGPKTFTSALDRLPLLYFIRYSLLNSRCLSVHRKGWVGIPGPMALPGGGMSGPCPFRGVYQVHPLEGIPQCLISSGGHWSGRYASYWNAILFQFADVLSNLYTSSIMPRTCASCSYSVASVLIESVSLDCTFSTDFFFLRLTLSSNFVDGLLSPFTGLE